jgi:hypothetical protein
LGLEKNKNLNYSFVIFFESRPDLATPLGNFKLEEAVPAQEIQR